MSTDCPLVKVILSRGVDSRSTILQSWKSQPFLSMKQAKREKIWQKWFEWTSICDSMRWILKPSLKAWCQISWLAGRQSWSIEGCFAFTCSLVSFGFLARKLKCQVWQAAIYLHLRVCQSQWKTRDGNDWMIESTKVCGDENQYE